MSHYDDCRDGNCPKCGQGINPNESPHEHLIVEHCWYCGHTWGALSKNEKLVCKQCKRLRKKCACLLPGTRAYDDERVRLFEEWMDHKMGLHNIAIVVQNRGYYPTSAEITSEVLRFEQFKKDIQNLFDRMINHLTR